MGVEGYAHINKSNNTSFQISAFPILLPLWCCSSIHLFCTSQDHKLELLSVLCKERVTFLSEEEQSQLTKTSEEGVKRSDRINVCEHLHSHTQQQCSVAENSHQERYFLISAESLGNGFVIPQINFFPSVFMMKAELWEMKYLIMYKNAQFERWMALCCCMDVSPNP